MQNQQFSIQAMVMTLGCSRLSIRHELYRCVGDHYCAIEAQKHANLCRNHCGRHTFLTSRLNRVITEKL